MDLRLAKETDIGAITDLWMAMMGEHAAFEPRLRLTPSARHAYQCHLMLRLRGPKSLTLVVEDMGRLVGFCHAYACQNLPMFEPLEFGYLSDIYLEPEYRGRGLGAELLGRVRAFFQNLNLTSLHLQVYHANEAGLRFWRRNGFEPFFQRMCLEEATPPTDAQRMERKDEEK